MDNCLVDRNENPRLFEFGASTSVKFVRPSQIGYSYLLCSPRRETGFSTLTTAEKQNISLAKTLVVGRRAGESRLAFCDSFYLLKSLRNERVANKNR